MMPMLQRRNAFRSGKRNERFYHDYSGNRRRKRNYCQWKLIYGHDGFAGELGHTIVKPGGRKHWSTGSEGSLEAYASATGITITAKKMRAEFPESMLNQYPEESINSKTVHECAMKEDPIAIEVFRYTDRNWERHWQIL
jgi:hypothetical protein